MAILAVYEEDKDTETYEIFQSLLVNKNVTVSDYMNAIQKIQEMVSAKYRKLNLE